MKVSHTQHQGFTLIELMITVMVLAIVLGIGLPSFRDSLARNNIKSEANRLVASINFARSQAVAKNQVVTLASISNTTKDWSRGWIVFSDFNSDGSNGPGNSAFAAGDVQLKTFAQNTSHMTVRTNTAAANTLSFNPHGRIIANGTGIKFAICDSDISSGIEGRLIDVNLVGRTSINAIPIASKTAQCTPN